MARKTWFQDFLKDWPTRTTVRPAGRRECRLEAEAAQGQGWPAEPVFVIHMCAARQNRAVL
jgi:hypothetical protein